MKIKQITNLDNNMWRSTDPPQRGFYDALGNVTEDIRTIALPGNNDVYRFKTQYTYDSWGRMDQMIYPDGEVVAYKYIWGGDLFAMDGDKNGTLQSYIRGIHYNKFGQRDSVQYGNGTRAHYTYDALHRLSRLTSFQLGGAVMQNIKYTFDSVSNIKRIQDSVLAIGTLGGGYDNTFNYDGLHRLGGSQGDNTLGHYRYTMDYTASGRIKNKHLRTPSSSLTRPADMFYGYCNDQKPHTVRRIFDEKNEKHFDLRWDDAGNLGQISIGNEDAKFETGRFLFWTEDNRMHAAVDEKYSSYYVYDHSGERRVKLTGTNDLLDVNADYMYTASVLKEPTIYPSAYLVMSNRGYTKHYYAGTERVAARIGGGGLNAIDQEHGLSDKSGSVFQQSLRQINDRILEKNNIECIANGLSSNNKLKIDMNEVPERLQAKLITDYDKFRHTIADAQSIHHNEPDVYFYHSDHLGSASWITDNGGLAVQHLQYLPYGERYVDQRAAGYNERFTFTGKERDEETGYGYFGARYMDHELMTMWLSVDPMADKYPSISPYAYCAWNPVKLVDPDGGKIKISGNIIYSPNMKSDGCDDFDKTAIDALNHLYSSEEGALMINKLCEYDGDIGIYEDFYTNYQVSGPETSFYNENEGKPGTGIFSEITINWNIENPESVPTLNGMQANATYNLLDEICHAYDLCTGYGTLAKTEEGDYKAEFQAVYRSNVVRHQLNDNNYRSQYYTNSKDSKGAGQKTARRRNNENVFYQPSWYPRCDTDNVSILSQGF